MSTDVSEVCAATIIAIALMMEAARTSETLVNIELRTWQYIPEDSELQINIHLIYSIINYPSITATKTSIIKIVKVQKQVKS
jgi:hypothetical protein